MLHLCRSLCHRQLCGIAFPSVPSFPPYALLYESFSYHYISEDLNILIRKHSKGKTTTVPKICPKVTIGIYLKIFLITNVLGFSFPPTC